MSMYGKDNVVSKALTLIGKLQHKYGFKPKFYDIVQYSAENEELPTILEEEIVIEDPPSADAGEEGEWCLVSSHGNVHRLPKTMIFLGREECDIEVQSDTVDKRHAVVTFDHYIRRFKIKDLSTDNGTYVNQDCIPEQEYVILHEQDSIRLGNDDSVTFQMERYEDRPNAVHEGETIFSPIDDELPPWANTDNVADELQSPVAECQGCIVEQRIEHTCSERDQESEAAHKDLDRSYSHDSIASFSLGCNTWPKKRYKTKKKAVHEIFGDMDEERSLHVEGLIDAPPSRVLRGTGAPMNKLPDELATVKKGTPLYGQPEWWGEEDSDLSIEKLRSNGSSMERVSSQDLEKAKDSRTNVSSSAGDSKNKETVDAKPNNNVPNKDSQSTETGELQSPEGITNMAFTVDFGDESKPHLDGKSIGDFMPSRLRKSFRERLEKSSEKSSSTSKSASKDKTTPDKSNTSKLGGRSVSEGRDLSPVRQNKIDELWNKSNSSTPESAASKRQKMMNKSLSSTSKSIDDESQDSSSKGTKTSSVRRRAPLSSNNSKPKSVIRARKAVSQEILASSAAYSSDKTAYLIDKMFQNNSTGSVDSLRTKDSNQSATEYDMYHEAVKYDPDISIRTSSQDFKPVYDKHDKSDKIRTKDMPVAMRKKSVDRISPEKEVDKVSDAGTYTIEEEKDSKEEVEARKNIDKIFGVDQISMTGSGSLSDDLKNKALAPDKQGELTLNLQNINLELEEIERLEKMRARPHMADSMEAELGSAESREFMEKSDNPNVPLDAPKWVSQWAALTNQKSQNKTDMELSSPGSSYSDESKSSGKGQNGISRKRPGTGRKLPTIPPGGPSPASSDRSPCKESPMLSGRSDLTVNGTSYPASSSQPRAIKGSSQNDITYNDVDLDSELLTDRNDEVDTVRDCDSHRKGGSNASIASLDTEVLLKDTHTVMTAMEQRMGSKPKIGNQHVKSDDSVKDKFNKESSYADISYHSGKDVNDSLVLDDSVDFESDTSSVVALVNGDEDFVKPSLYKSPREALGKGKLKLTESLPSKPLLKLSGAKARTYSTEKERKLSNEESRAVSDIFSDINGTTARTDDLDTSDPTQFNRQGSKGKGQMSMTRPNRAFALRRARADGDEQLDTSRSSATSVSTASAGFRTPRGGSLTNLAKTSSTTPQKPRRPMSGILADRPAPDSQRSQASLGTQIVQKSRENINAGFNRVDGGRHSLRTTRSMSIPVQQHTPSTKSRRSDGTSSSIQHSKSLRVTGVSARERSSSVTKSGGRSNSPKSAERNAWKRRKEYDPRRAVAEAKSKHKDSKRRSDGMEVFNKTRGVTRSASFTNSRDLKLCSYHNDSVSSTEDYSRRSSGASDVFDEPKRGFVPYSMRSLMSSKVSTSSADDDEMDKSARSSSAQSTQSYDTLIVSSIYQLSLKLKTQTDRTMEKLRDSDVIENGLDSPLDELDNQSGISEIPAYKSANQELAGVLKNLRKLEQHIKVINKVLFPDYDGSPDTSKEKHEYLQEIERIKNELSGFQPIETPREDIWKQEETASIESDCEELSHSEYY